MNSVTCPKCSGQIAAGAVVCRHCHARLGRGKRPAGITVLAVALGALALLFACGVANGEESVTLRAVFGAHAAALTLTSVGIFLLRRFALVCLSLMLGVLACEWFVAGATARPDVPGQALMYAAILIVMLLGSVGWYAWTRRHYFQ